MGAGCVGAEGPCIIPALCRRTSKPPKIQSPGPRKITSPIIIPRADHPISRANISRGAIRVLYTLKDAGYEAYLVGGGLRDLLLGREPKDFDIATSARPEELQVLFK